MNSFYHYLFNRKAVPVTLLLGTFVALSYHGEHKILDLETTTVDQHEEMVIKIMQDHLGAVSNRDLTALKSTLSPDDTMQFILPGREMTTTAEDFIRYHQEWFQDTTWTLESEILDAEIGKEIAITITEILYREPDRKGKPYFNRMIVSYGLKNVDGKWYVFKDHASSIETSEKQ